MTLEISTWIAGTLACGMGVILLGSVEMKVGRARISVRPPFLAQKFHVMPDSCHFLLITLLMQLCESGVHAKDRVDATAEATSDQTACSHEFSRLDPLDSRRWSRVGDAILLTDLSLVRPTSALVRDKRRKKKWKVIPYATQSFAGQSLSAYAETDAPAVSLPLETSGWYAVYVGVGTVSNGIVETTNVVRVKLSGYGVFRRMSNHQRVRDNNDRRDSIEEVLLTVADLTDQAFCR